MSKTKLEYIWLDGYTPTQSLRSKTKIVRTLTAPWTIVLPGALTEVPQNRHLEDHLIVSSHLLLCIPIRDAKMRSS